MSDLPPFDRVELASAYLDGVLSPDERALIEADATLMAVVAELRAVEQAVADVPGPPPGARAGAMAAAMAAFDELHGPVTVVADSTQDDTGELPGLPLLPVGDPFPAPAAVPPAPVVSLEAARQRRAGRAWRLLPAGGAVAAALVVGAIVVSQRGGDDSTDLAEAPAGVTEAAALDAAAGTDFVLPDFGAAGAAEAEGSEEMAISEEATAAAEAAADTQSSIVGGAAKTEAPAETEAPAAVTEAPAETIPQTTVAGPPTPQQLVDLGVRDEPPALAELDAIEPTVDIPLCDGKAIARITYQGTEALVLRRESGAVAIVVIDCSVLAEIAV